MTASHTVGPRGPELKRDWVPSREAFQQLLAWLDRGTDSGGERYTEMRRRLVAYFDRKGCRVPEDLADDTLNRVARRLQEEGTITDAPPAQYCYIVARFVFLEHLRSADRRVFEFGIPEAVGARYATPPAGTMDPREMQLDCLDGCLHQLTPADRELILAYYSGDQGTRIAARKTLAARLGVSLNALTIRASRIRARLEACVAGCLKNA